MNKTKNILLLSLAFMIVGLVSVFLTHQPSSSAEFVYQEDYIDYISPWIDSIYVDQSLDNVSTIKNNFLEFKGSDKSIGPAHLALFLAFDSWEKFLLTGEIASKEKSISHFATASDLLPDFSHSIDSLGNILKEQDV